MISNNSINKWDYSEIPKRQWRYDEKLYPYSDNTEDSINPDMQYTVIEIREDGVSHYFFNETQNVATWGGHGGVLIPFEQFLDFDDKEIGVPSNILKEIRELILFHRKPIMGSR